MVLGTQEARVEKVLHFLTAPSRLSDKDLAAKVCVLIIHFDLHSHSNIVRFVIKLCLCQSRLSYLLA